MANKSRKVRLARLASRQCGRVATRQLVALGIAKSTIHKWCEAGYLTRVLPHVYAVGHVAPGRKANLWAAVLYAGPGAAISHATAAHHRGLIDYSPAEIEVTTPHNVRSIAGIVKVFAKVTRQRELVDGVPTCLIADTIIDTAATGTPQMIKRALAQLDYRRKLTPEMIAAIEACCRRGRPGSTTTRQALKNHKPQYAHANSRLEILFIDLCAKWRIPMPRCNIKLYGITVDAHWPQYNLVVETDGNGNHATAAQVDRDRTNDLTLRNHGLTVLRYSKRQLREDHGPIRKDLIRHMQEHASQPRLRRAA